MSLALALFGWSCGALAQAVMPQHAVKAALVFNFAVFTQWPADAFPGPNQPFVLCYADERMVPAFASLAGKTVHGRPLATRRIGAGAATVGCQLGYWSGHAHPPAASEAPRGMLLVAETEGFAGRGGMVELSMEDSRVAFEVNVESARAAGLRVSSKLLRLARKVHGNPEH